MNAALKLLQAMRRNPADDWQMSDLLTLAKRYGLSVRSTGGTPCVFARVAGGNPDGAGETSDQSDLHQAFFLDALCPTGEVEWSSRLRS